MNSVVREFALRDHRIPLSVSPEELFMPNQVTKFFSEAVRIDEGDIVFDIGSGVGPLAIWAALKPSEHVHAVEIVNAQYEMLRKNIADNGVAHKVTPYQGSFFDPLPRDLRADVIIGDVSGIAEELARELGWYPPSIPTGGPDGTEVIISVLQQAGKYLKPDGRLYFPVAVGLSDSDKIMRVAQSHFGSLEKRIDQYFPLDERQRDCVLARASSNPYIRLVKRGSRHWWQGLIYEAAKSVAA